MSKKKAKTITLRITDINYSININKKLFLEDLELILDSYSEVREAIAIFEAKTKSGKYDNLDATELQKLKCVFDKAWETGRLKDDTGRYFVPVCGIFFKRMDDAISYIKTKTDVDMTIVRSDKTNLEMIRTLDKFHLAMLLNHICADSKNCPSSTTGWCEWLGNNWNFMN